MTLFPLSVHVHMLCWTKLASEISVQLVGKMPPARDINWSFVMPTLALTARFNKLEVCVELPPPPDGVDGVVPVVVVVVVVVELLLSLVDALLRLLRCPAVVLVWVDDVPLLPPLPLSVPVSDPAGVEPFALTILLARFADAGLLPNKLSHALRICWFHIKQISSRTIIAVPVA
jgi:hypothetical protein